MRFNLNEKETKKFVSLFNQHEQNIDYMLYLSETIWQNNNINATLFENKNAFEKRMLFADELLKNKPSDSEFVKKSLRWDTNLISIDEYNDNPYLKALHNITFSSNNWRLESKTLKAYSLFPHDEEYHMGGNALVKMNLGFFDQDYVYPTLTLYDNEWMSLNPFEIKTMEIPFQIARGKVLTLGLGLGYFAYMTHLKEEVKEVHIVEMDIDVIKAFTEYLLPLFPHPEKIHIHKADAFYFVENLKDRDYDYIFSDLWHNVDDGLVSYLKLRKRFNAFKHTRCTYWMEGSIVTYLRTLVIGVMKDEYFKTTHEYDDIQLMIKERLKDFILSNSDDLDSLLSIRSLQTLFAL